MAIANLWKFFVRDSEDNEARSQEEEERHSASATQSEGETPFRGPRRPEIPTPTINAPTDQRVEDEPSEAEETAPLVTLSEPVIPEPIDMRPAEAPDADAEESAAEEEHEAVAEEPVSTEASTETEEPEAPAFKLVRIVNLAAAYHAIDLLARGYVIIADTSSLDEEMLATLTCFMAGGVYALGGHIYPADETNAFLSLAEFDPAPYLPEEEA